MLKYHTVAVHSLNIGGNGIGEMGDGSDISILSPDELERANKLTDAHHRNRFIAARTGLRKLLEEYTGILARELRFEYGKDGKPALHSDMKSNFRFNMAHSGDMAIYAFAIDIDVGIDVERVRELHNIAKIAKRFFTDEEARLIDNTPLELRSMEFLKLWTKREALAKLSGMSVWHEPKPQTNISISTFTPRLPSPVSHLPRYIACVAAAAPQVYFSI